ncbi:MAG: winged helix-turn-helix domain-containing protein [Streptosporangiaceae bacterium]
MAAPLYGQIADDLRRRIESGELRECVRVPTEDQLMEAYRASRNTVRGAVKELTASSATLNPASVSSSGIGRWKLPKLLFRPGTCSGVPTADETLRIKGYLVVRRNQVRDYIDVAAPT